jgi:hypothetical protein
MLVYQRVCVFFVFFFGSSSTAANGWLADYQCRASHNWRTPRQETAWNWVDSRFGKMMPNIHLTTFFFRFYGISKNHCIQSIHIVTMGYLTVSKIRFLLLKGYFSWHNKWFHHISESEVWGNKIGSPKPGGSQWLVMVSLVMVRIPLYVIPIKSINLSHKSI